FLFRLFFVFSDVRVIFTGELAKGLFNIGVTCTALNAQNSVIIFVFNGHVDLKPDSEAPERMMPGICRLSKGGESSKFEIRNLKQIRISKAQTTESGPESLLFE